MQFAVFRGNCISRFESNLLEITRTRNIMYNYLLTRFASVCKLPFVYKYCCLFVCLNGQLFRKKVGIQSLGILTHIWGIVPFKEILGTELKFLPPKASSILTPHNGCNLIPPMRGTKQVGIWSDSSVLRGCPFMTSDDFWNLLTPLPPSSDVLLVTLYL